jgi:hypothetical protein
LLAALSLTACSNAGADQFDLSCRPAENARDVVVFSIDLSRRAIYLHNPDGRNRPDEGRVLPITSATPAEISYSNPAGYLRFDRNSGALVTRGLFGQAESRGQCEKRQFSFIPDTRF